MEAIIVFITQLLFQIVRTKSTLMIIDDKVIGATIMSAATQTLWMISTFIGVAGMMNGSFIPAAAYIAGGTLGTYLTMRNK